MTQELIEIPVIKNEKNSRFELTVDGYTAFIDYLEQPNIIKLIHTESPEELAGRGVAKALIEKTLTYLEINEFKVVPICPLVFAFIKKNPEWLRIVRDDFKVKFID